MRKQHETEQNEQTQKQTPVLKNSKSHSQKEHKVKSNERRHPPLTDYLGMPGKLRAQLRHWARY